MVPPGANVNAEGPFNPVLTATAPTAARCPVACGPVAIATADPVATEIVVATMAATTRSLMIRCIDASLELAVTR
jgi:hypothetical protein